MVMLAALAASALSLHAHSHAQSALPSPCLPGKPTTRHAKSSGATTLDLARLRDIGTPDPALASLRSPIAISPDQQTLAFLVSRGDPVTNKFCRALVTIEARPKTRPRVLNEGGEMILSRIDLRGSLVTTGAPETIVPGWSPDGRLLAWLRRDGGVTQVWRVSQKGGDAAPVTASPVDIENWAWASNSQIVTVSRPSQIAEQTQIMREGKTGWLYDMRVTPSAGPRPMPSANLEHAFRTYDIALGTNRPATMQEKALIVSENAFGFTASAPIVSRTGHRAWLEEDGSPLFGSARIRAAGPDGVARRCDADVCAGRIVTLAWQKDGSTLVFLRRQPGSAGRMAFYMWRPDGGRPTRVSVTDDFLLGCSPQGEKFVCLRETAISPRRLVEIDPKTGQCTTLYDPNPEWGKLDLGTVRRLALENDRGLPFHADLVLPPDYRPSERLPMVVVQYRSQGFLRGGTGEEFPIFPLASRRFAVLSIDRPESVGHALPGLRSFSDLARAEQTDWAERRSMLSATLVAVQEVIRLGIADPKRVGISGFSDGATAARFALINSDAFAVAAISSSAIEPNTVMTYGGIAWAEENRMLGFPLASRNDRQFWNPMSLAQNAANIRAPLLIQASDEEFISSLETFAALREHGKAVELIVFPGEHHVKWQPVHKKAAYDRAIDWFSFWLQGTIDPAPDKAEQFRRWRAMRPALGVPSMP